jgi:hypothetical protein
VSKARPDIYEPNGIFIRPIFISYSYIFIRHMWGYLSAKYVLFSQIFIIQPNGNYSVKYYSAKYYSAKSNIIQPNEILFSQVGILFSQTAGWLASEGRCELAKSLHSEICRQARYYHILYVCIGQIPATCCAFASCLCPWVKLSPDRSPGNRPGTHPVPTTLLTKRERNKSLFF